jgi:hypothetical protein
MRISWAVNTDEHHGSSPRSGLYFIRLCLLIRSVSYHKLLNLTMDVPSANSIPSLFADWLCVSYAGMV